LRNHDAQDVVCQHDGNDQWQVLRGRPGEETQACYKEQHFARSSALRSEEPRDDGVQDEGCG